MTAGANGNSRQRAPIPSSGHFDANQVGDDYDLPSAEDLRTAFLRPDNASDIGAENEPQQLTISNLGVFEPLDLSFEMVDIRVIFRNCALNGGLRLTRATLPGLELYDVATPEIDLDWARVDGDVRLVNVRPPQPRTLIEPRPAESPPAQVEPLQYTTVRSTGAVITGDVSLPGSHVHVDEADALLARRRPAPEANAGVLTWERFFQAAGLGSALVAWVAVVGGATLWARMESIDAPALPTLAALGQSWMITAGLQTLLVPILLGGSVALLVYFSRWDPVPTSQPDDPTFAGDRQPPREEATQRKTEKGAGTTERTWHRIRNSLTRRDGPKPAVGQSETLPFRRARPLVALRRVNRRTRRIAVLAVAVIGAMLAAALYVAQASWEVLATTLLIIVTVFVAVGFQKADGGTGRPSERAKPGKTLGVGARPRSAVIPWGLTAVCAGFPSGLVWDAGGATTATAVSVGVISALVAIVLVAIGRWSTRPAAFPLAVMIVAATGVFMSLLVTVELGWLLFMAAVTALSLWVSLGALVDRSHGAAAITVFAAIVVWSGALQYAREIGDRVPEFPRAEVVLKSGDRVTGLLVGRSSEVVLVADQDDEESPNGREVHVIPVDQVHQLDYGNEVVPDGLPPEDPKASPNEWTWWNPLTWQVTPWLVGHVEDAIQEVNPEDDTDDTDDTDGTDGTDGNNDGGNDDEDTQPPYDPVPQEPFESAEALDVIDAEVDGSPVRLELLSVQRSEDAVYLWLRAVNMDDRSPHTVAAMLGLPQGDFNTPHLIDAIALRSYQVSQSDAICDCARNLDTVSLQPFEQRNVMAEFVVHRDVSSVDVVVPAVGTFSDVVVE